MKTGITLARALVFLQWTWKRMTHSKFCRDVIAGDISIMKIAFEMIRLIDNYSVVKFKLPSNFRNVQYGCQMPSRAVFEIESETEYSQLYVAQSTNICFCLILKKWQQSNTHFSVKVTWWPRDIDFWPVISKVCSLQIASISVYPKLWLSWHSSDKISNLELAPGTTLAEIIKKLRQFKMLT